MPPSPSLSRLRPRLPGSLLALLVLGCGSESTATGARRAEPRLAEEAAAVQKTGTRWPEVEVVGEHDPVPPGGDGAPRLRLAFRYADGSRVAIEGEARAFTPFRDGVALVDPQGALWLVSPRGARRMLAREAIAPPVRGPSGELLYVTRHGLNAELHVLQADGRSRVLGAGFASAGMLAPQVDGRVLFVAARSGGVAGLWVADRAGARCLSNCELGRAPWGDALVPLPPGPEALQVEGDRVRWEASDGTRHELDLVPPSLPDPDETPRLPQDGNTRPAALQEAK